MSKPVAPGRADCTGQMRRCLAIAAALAVFSAPTQAAPADDCPERVAAAVCLVAPMRNLLRSTKVLERRCIAGSDRYASALVALYDRFPPLLKRTMCKLDRIFVEKSFWASGYAHPYANAIGIQSRFLRNAPSLSAWATWKERLAFDMKQLPGLIRQGAPIRLPRIVADAPGRTVTAGEYIVAHELAHRIDIDASSRPARQFARQFWAHGARAYRLNGMPRDWQRPCFYRCQRPRLSLGEIGTVYDRLSRAPVVSLYAAKHPQEDFAETVVSYMMWRRGTRFDVMVGDRVVLDLERLWTSAHMSGKRAYMDVLFGAADAS